jgi:hypothetical protein
VLAQSGPITAPLTVSCELRRRGLVLGRVARPACDDLEVNCATRERRAGRAVAAALSMPSAIAVSIPVISARDASPLGHMPELAAQRLGMAWTGEAGDPFLHGG